VLDTPTTSAEPTIALSWSVVLGEIGDDPREQAFERLIPIVFACEQQRLPIDKPAIFTRARRPQRNDAAPRPVAEQPFDDLHRADQLFLRGRFEPLEHREHFLDGCGVERFVSQVALLGECNERLPRVGFGRAPGDQVAALEAGQQAAQIAAIESQIARENGGGLRSPACQFMQDTDLGQRERALLQMLVQRTDVLRIEAVEVADSLSAPQRCGIGQRTAPPGLCGFHRSIYWMPSYIKNGKAVFEVCIRNIGITNV